MDDSSTISRHRRSPSEPHAPHEHEAGHRVRAPQRPEPVIVSPGPETAPEGRPSLAVALGSGGARGLSHILVLEALDELGLRPTAMAGASIGALFASAYAAGMPARDIRHLVTHTLRNRGEVMKRLLAARVGRITDLFGGLGNPVLVDAERVIDGFIPGVVPQNFEDLQIPLQVVATDYWERCERTFAGGPIRPAVAASLAIPGLFRAVQHDGHTLFDGGAVNPLPFDLLRSKADIVIAVDITGGHGAETRGVPAPFEAMFATLQIMASAIVGEKLKAGAPDILIRPNVHDFRVLDFFRATAILKAAEPVKDEVKRRLEAVLG
ncbi:Patatin [Ancylobacter novellus DSM 506]|uniref:Patatin n=1 Tax=Ancylobacter novellus (strain ATCC 8093 / DSM 506 / JCM 20403 / CCM 1077 / IAM 12100 / NBRC 12443 / NCIMB 10456) TaxID=639283 RepID=D6ZZJ1_ANCN5|nr:patatin-like phospholipase family protein [Ancylobacter novellus]ADH91186.1 Patatin [Ancylobacter novellus DSM 506]